MGVGAKLFTLAGPVLVYGISSSVIVGLITFFLDMMWMNAAEHGFCGVLLCNRKLRAISCCGHRMTEKCKGVRKWERHWPLFYILGNCEKNRKRSQGKWFAKLLANVKDCRLIPDVTDIWHFAFLKWSEWSGFKVLMQNIVRWASIHAVFDRKGEEKFK